MKKAPETDLEDFWFTSKNIRERPLYIEAGDLCVTICRRPYEWQVNHHWVKRDDQGTLFTRSLEENCESKTPPDRIAMETMSSDISLHPRLADRSIVARPISPFVIPSNNTITLYVSTPLWLSIKFSQNLEQELPVQQLSDTWMGPIFGNGVLCYGSKTHARLDKNLLPNLPFRALTPISINNEGSEDFRLERLNIPTPHLSLFEGESQFFTEPLSFSLDATNQKSKVTIGDMMEEKLVTPPRDNIDKSIFGDAWETLFG